MKKYIGADIGGTSIKLGVIYEDGSLISRTEIKHDHVTEVMDELINGISIITETEEISGIGVSAAGCVNSSEGSIAGNGGNVRNWSWTPVCSILEERFGIPASLSNDANCAVLGESWKGAARGYSDVVGITLGTGVGGGIITGGRLLEGAYGYAGEIGHFPTHAGLEECVCGIAGCYERYASTSALTRRAAAAVDAWGSGRAFFEAVGSGDKKAKLILDEWIEEIAYGIAGYIHIFNPQLILIGGGVSAQEELLIKPLREKTLGKIMPDFARGLEFRSASLGNDAGIIGALCYHLNKTDRREGSRI